MPIYPYLCRGCGLSFDSVSSVAERNDKRICKCGVQMERLYNYPVGITGTRDSFGIGNSFRDEKTGKVIDNYKSWYKAGYRSAVDSIDNSEVKAGVKRKIEKITKYDNKRRFSVNMGDGNGKTKKRSRGERSKVKV